MHVPTSQPPRARTGNVALRLLGALRIVALLDLALGRLFSVRTWRGRMGSPA